MAIKRKKSAVRRKKTTYRRRPAARRGQRKLPNWSLLVLGLAIGIIVAVLVQWIVSTVNTPGSGLHNILTRPEKPATKPATAEKKPAQKTSYDFYTLLPESETVVDDSEWREIRRTQDTNVSFVLQAAAYNHYADADRLKAKLALNGLPSTIQKVTVGNKRVYYRVRLGPFRRAIDADDANRKLAKLGIKALRLKVKN